MVFQWMLKTCTVKRFPEKSGQQKGWWVDKAKCLTFQFLHYNKDSLWRLKHSLQVDNTLKVDFAQSQELGNDQDKRHILPYQGNASSAILRLHSWAPPPASSGTSSCRSPWWRRTCLKSGGRPRTRCQTGRSQAPRRGRSGKLGWCPSPSPPPSPSPSPPCLAGSLSPHLGSLQVEIIIRVPT